MTKYTAYDLNNSDNHVDGLSLDEALAERWDVDGSRRGGGWGVMTDDDFRIMRSLTEDQYVECAINKDGTTSILRVAG